MTSAPPESELETELTEETDEEEATSSSYEITAYPADYTLKVLNDKWTDGQFTIPDYQRNYVWNRPQASKLIESFLLGLPVPQIFLYKERRSPQLFVVDGQQRLRTIASFYSGRLPDGQLFTLHGVDPRWVGKTYADLDSDDQTRFDDTVLRSMIIQQIDANDQSSVYLIFERLNTGGTQLNPMEVRKAVYHGPAYQMLDRLNGLSAWRELLAQPRADARLKDVELILRVISLARGWEQYTKPMKGFVTAGMIQLRSMSQEQRDTIETQFKVAVERARDRLGARPFHVRGRLNVAALDGILAPMMILGEQVGSNTRTAYDSLLEDEEFLAAISISTSDADTVKRRIRLALAALAE
ncbi:MAG: DUF262 domain-containing protein [Dehalococcoidia bacterium]|nr:DUF262 domain-containing protein [Dehalococcoidia bacterium]